MITISNLRLEDYDSISGQKSCRVVCDLFANFTDVHELYFWTDANHRDWLTADVYDAFMVALLYPAMYYNEQIEVKGKVSKKLYNNIINYVEAIVQDFNNSVHRVNITVQGFSDAKKNENLHIGTGFSGGVDSFSTLTDRFWGTCDPDYKVDTLCFFHVGQYGDVKEPSTHIRAKNRYAITENFAKEIGIDSLMLSTNLFDLYIPDWEYKVGVLCRITSVLVLQSALKRYYISNAYTYGEMIDLAHDRVFLEEFSDPYIMPLMSPPGLEIVCDGAQYTRFEKTKRISTNPLAQQYLNVCVNSSVSHIEAKNCGHCTKCLRTMMALDIIGALDVFNNVFKRSDWENNKQRYIYQQVIKYGVDGFATDNINAAKMNGYPVPSRIEAEKFFSNEKLKNKYRGYAYKIAKCCGLITIRNFIKKL